jgi:hypothetical protein
MEDAWTPQLDVLLVRQRRVVEMRKVDLGIALTCQTLKE